MIISDKQHEANRRNAQHSHGPTTPEGKAAVRLNALTYGLRARSTILPDEDPEEYKRLWASLETEWQPQSCTERIYLEQMSTSQWLLARVANGENDIYLKVTSAEQQLALLDRVRVQRTSLERSFTSALRELQRLQKERRGRPQTKPAQPVKNEPTQTAHRPSVEPPDYLMSDAADTATPDSR